MSHLYPRKDAIHGSISSSMSVHHPQLKASPPASYQGRPELYGAWSTVDDAKDKAQKLSAEATKEFEKASAKAQAKAGKIELFSPKYYAACTFGGMMACVCLPSAPQP